jgi:hypothetical protein
MRHEVLPPHPTPLIPHPKIKKALENIPRAL